MNTPTLRKPRRVGHPPEESKVPTLSHKTREGWGTRDSKNQDQIPHFWQIRPEVGHPDTRGTRHPAGMR
jgi:hypothetical protein